jgi:hypothetical protein
MKGEKKVNSDFDKSPFWNPVKQPMTDNNLCGHCCLATALGITLEEAIKKIGHVKGTKSKDLLKHFSGYEKVFKEAESLSLCVARPAGSKKGNWHWVLSMNGIIYDPNYGCWLKKEAWAIQTEMKITSWNILII